MSADEEVTRLEFVYKSENQTYEVDRITIILFAQGYNVDRDVREAEDKRNTILSISINNKSESNRHNQNKRSPYQLLKLEFRYHYGTAFQDQESWVYDLTLREHGSDRKLHSLDPDFFRVTQDDHWVRVEWLSHTRKETYGGTSTTVSPDELVASLAIPTSGIISLRTFKDQKC
jgi:hypothetical protein